MPKPRIAVSMGDPAGIGPEVIVKALADRKLAASLRPLVVGDAAVMARAVHVCGAKLKVVPVAGSARRAEAPGVLQVLDTGAESGAVVPGRWTRETGRASLAAVTTAALLVRAGGADALVTAPICKEAWRAAGARVPGHTEYLAGLLKTREYAMMFTGGPFKLVLATIHEPLRAVPRLLTSRRIVRAAGIAAGELRRRFGVAKPRIAVAGLNPHAGEGGLLGTEERRVVVPAVRTLARDRRWSVEGPFAPDTLFARAQTGEWDLVVCLYHDQGLIPFKMLALHTGVNVTAGLPIIRTSPDHGTAFDLAGTGRADPGSMAAALRTAVQMVKCTA